MALPPAPDKSRLLSQRVELLLRIDALLGHDLEDVPGGPRLAQLLTLAHEKAEVETLAAVEFLATAK